MDTPHAWTAAPRPAARISASAPCRCCSWAWAVAAASISSRFSRNNGRPLTDFRMIIDGEREKGKEPTLWEKVHVVFDLKGHIDPDKAKKACELSMDKYCSVAATLREAHCKITWEVNQINDLNHSLSTITLCPHTASRKPSVSAPTKPPKKNIPPRSFLTSSFCYDDAEDMRAVFADEKEAFMYSPLQQSHRPGIYRPPLPPSKARKPASPPPPA
jgi:hypothetical protein